MERAKRGRMQMIIYQQIIYHVLDDSVSCGSSYSAPVAEPPRHACPSLEAQGEEPMRRQEGQNQEGSWRDSYETVGDVE